MRMVELVEADVVGQVDGDGVGVEHGDRDGESGGSREMRERWVYWRDRKMMT